MDTDLKRRQFLKYLLANSAITATMCVGLIVPHTVLAAWPKSAFEATTIPAALKMLLGNDEAITKRFAIKIKTRPHLDDGGTQITVTITTSIPDIDSITLLSTSSRTPLIASFIFGGKTVKSLATRIKMEHKGDVIAIIKSGDRLYSETTSVDFSGCGCG